MKIGIVDAVLVICAVTVTGVVVRREIVTPPAPAAADVTRFVRNSHQYDDPKRREGTSEFGVVAVLFSDYQCPFCAAMDHRLDSLISGRYQGQVSLVVRHFPLDPIHPLARSAAIAAECARGFQHFLEYHRALFAHQKTLTRDSFLPIARDVGIVDTIGFRRCLDETSSGAVVAADVKAGESLDLRGTPVLILGDSSFTGAMSVVDLDARLSRAVALQREDRRRVVAPSHR